MYIYIYVFIYLHIHIRASSDFFFLLFRIPNLITDSFSPLRSPARKMILRWKQPMRHWTPEQGLVRGGGKQFSNFGMGRAVFWKIQHSNGAGSDRAAAVRGPHPDSTTESLEERAGTVVLEVCLQAQCGGRGLVRGCPPRLRRRCQWGKQTYSGLAQGQSINEFINELMNHELKKEDSDLWFGNNDLHTKSTGHSTH